MVLIILQCNGRSLTANGQECILFIAEQYNKPHVICIQETWLKPPLDFKVQGYNNVLRGRISGVEGGVATFVMEGIKFRAVKIFNKYEVVEIEVCAGDQKIRMINYYNPCERLSRDIL